jgi:hypothetical protein
MTKLRKNAVILVMGLCSTLCLAEWEVVSVATAKFERKSYQGQPEVQMTVRIRNTSGKTIYLWGQDFAASNKWYMIESFIQNTADAVWERQNAGMCGSEGRIGWIVVQPGETIQQTSTLFQKFVGQQILLTFRRAYSEADSKGAEILLGPFKIPKPEKSESPVGGDEKPASQP